MSESNEMKTTAAEIDAELKKIEAIANRAQPRPLADIIGDLSKPLHPDRLKTKTIDGRSLTYLPWYQAVRYLDHYASGWTSEIIRIDTVTATIYEKVKGKDGKQMRDPETDQPVFTEKLQTSLTMTVRISIPTAEGIIHREASALEVFGAGGYGDPATNAESAALRRAAAKFGLGLYLYDK